MEIMKNIYPYLKLLRSQYKNQACVWVYSFEGMEEPVVRFAQDSNSGSILFQFHFRPRRQSTVHPSFLGTAGK